MFRAWSSKYWSYVSERMPVFRQQLRNFMADIPVFSFSSMHGRGIVIVAGGPLLEMALTTVQMLRDYGCGLAIEIWHLRSEISSAHLAIFRRLGVSGMEFEQHTTAREMKPVISNVGVRLFQLKSLAVLHSHFEEVLLLDADNTPLRDVEYLFDHPVYKRSHVVIWPDYWKTSPSNPIWDIIGSPPLSDWEQDSGQFMINKRHAWAEVNLLVHFSMGIYPTLMNGEKDALRYVCIALRSECHMIQTRVVPVGMMKPNGRMCGHTMLQHDFDGEAVFVHHNMVKTHAGSIGVNFKHKMAANPGYEAQVRTAATFSLALPSGFEIYCFELQGMMHPFFDTAVSIVDSGLGSFEETFAVILARMARVTDSRQKLGNH